MTTGITKVTSTLLRVTMVPINSGTTGTCTGPTSFHIYCADVHLQSPGHKSCHVKPCQDIYNQKHHIYDYDNDVAAWFGTYYGVALPSPRSVALDAQCHVSERQNMATGSEMM